LQFVYYVADSLLLNSFLSSHLLYCATKWDASQQREQHKITTVGTNLSVAPSAQIFAVCNAFGPAAHKEPFVRKANRNHVESLYNFSRKHWD